MNLKFLSTLFKLFFSWFAKKEPAQEKKISTTTKYDYTKHNATERRRYRLKNNRRRTRGRKIQVILFRDKYGNRTSVSIAHQ